MFQRPSLAIVIAFSTIPVVAAPAPKEPPPAFAWPMFGGTPSRNMVNLRDTLTPYPHAGPDWHSDQAGSERWLAEWVLWKADLGSRTHGSPVIADGRVYISTNNDRPRNPRDTRRGNPTDKGVLMCFDQKTGRFLWQAVHDKLLGRVNDESGIGVTSTPTVVGNRVYYVSNQCRVVCADVNGFVDGNQGIQNEQYHDPTDADIIWEYDMVRELNVFPHAMSNGCPLIVGDKLFVTTSNGVNAGHVKVPSPNAPSLICLGRSTGQLLWSDNSPGKDIMHGQWSSPSYAAEPVPQVIHGQGDGWLRAFDPATGKLLWKFDGNRKGAKHELGGTGEKSDFNAAPVVHNGRVYIGTGQDPEHSTGLAHLWCIDLKRAVELGAKAPDRDVSTDLLVRVEKQPNGEEKAVTKPNPSSALAWVLGGEERRKWARRDFKFGRTMSTVAVVDDIVYAAELAGHVHCLNAHTGESYWQYDTMASIWASPYYVDGKVLVATDAGDLFVFRHDPKPTKFDGLGAAHDAPDLKAARKIIKATQAEIEKKYLLAKIEFPMPFRTTPTVVNGVLYVATETTLYAIGKK